MTATKIEDVLNLKKGLTLLTAGTPNGFKVTIFLELLGLDYYYKQIDFSKKNENKEEWFVNYNPNSKIPTLLVVDDEGKVTHSIGESAAILIYLADTYDKEHKYHYPLGHPLHYDELTWIFFQMASLGPQQGQAHHFVRYAPEKIPYGIKRYTAETNRLYDVLEYQLKRNGTGYIVGDKITIADVLSWPWIRSHDWATVSLDNRPNLQQWFDKLGALEAFKKGTSIP